MLRFEEVLDLDLDPNLGIDLKSLCSEIFRLCFSDFCRVLDWALLLTGGSELRDGGSADSSSSSLDCASNMALKST